MNTETIVLSKLFRARREAQTVRSAFGAGQELTSHLMPDGSRRWFWYDSDKMHEGVAAGRSGEAASHADALRAAERLRRDNACFCTRCRRSK